MPSRREQVEQNVLPLPIEFARQKTDPGRVAAWISERPGLRPKTLQLYRYLLRRHVLPGFAGQTVAGISEADVRHWRADLLATGVSPVTTAKAYRLLKSIMATGADDGLIRRNPCRLKGASAEKSPERPVLTVAEVYALAEAVGPRYRALVLLACFCGLRWGELAALRRCDIDTAIIRVTRQLTETPGQPLHFGPPKSDAGRRVVVIPPLILPDVQAHLADIAACAPEVVVFTSPAGKLLRHPNFRRGVWLPALAATGLTGVHFHDLRHAGNHMVASAGASLRELMDRMGHSSPRAALIYQHSTDERQRALAEAVAPQAQAALDAGARGTYGARPAPAAGA
ncbi:MAG: tyrosine-type recombinase/integrase [Streptosporangiaceae bacterium]